MYLANARASAFLQLSFWLPTKLSTVTAMARSMSCAEQYSESRILQKASLMRMMASRWRTCATLALVTFPFDMPSSNSLAGVTEGDLR